jgi:hypothetical protein
MDGAEEVEMFSLVVEEQQGKTLFSFARVVYLEC